MSARAALLVCLFAACCAAAAESPALDRKAGGIVLRLNDDDQPRDPDAPKRTPRPLESGETMLISFPRPMVTAADFEKPIAEPPVVFTPALPLRFRWKSATEGELTVRGPLWPGTAYRLGLRPGLRDLSGQPVEVPAWGFAWPAARFRVRLSGGATRDDWLSPRPAVQLHFSHPVAAAEVARTALWRDELGRTIECEVVLGERTDPLSATDFTLMPLAPLEPDHSYEVLVEDTRCALEGSRLPFVHVFPLGSTRALQVKWVRALHQPQLGTFLDLRFDQSLDQEHPATTGTVRVTPAVKISDVKMTGPDLRVFGEFQPDVRYRVDLAPDALKSRRGFGLAEPAQWHATFGAKRSAVILSRSVLTTPAARGLDVDFVQVNTGPLRWQLARVPFEHLVAVRERLDEYRALDKSQRDPRTNEFPLEPTTLLVADLNLPVVAEGSFDATDGDREVSRTVGFTSAQMRGGVYLLELSGLARDGRIAGNRALVVVNREFLVWKNDRIGPHARLFDLASGEPVAGATVRVFSHQSRLLGEGVTDAAGGFEPGKFNEHGSPELVLIERDGAQSAHFTEFAGPVPWSREPGRSTATRHWLTTDRGIYRPGETIHVKGIVRVSEGDAPLRLPDASHPVAWEVRRLTDHEPVLTGVATLSETGAWETEVVLPAALPLGSYAISIGDHATYFKIDEFRPPAFSVELHPVEPATGRTSRVRVVSNYFHGAPNAQALVRWRAVWSPHEPYASYDARGPVLTTSDYSSPDRELRPPAWIRAVSDAAEADASAQMNICDGTAVLYANGAADLQSAAPFPATMRLSAADVRWEISVVAPEGQTVGAAGGQLLPLARAHPAVGLASARPGEIELHVSAVDHQDHHVEGVPLTVTVYRVETKTVRENLSSHVVRYRNTPVHTVVLTRDIVSPFRETVAVTGTGRFLAVAELTGVPASPRASTETTVPGRAYAQFARWDDVSLELQPDRPGYVVGETAHVAVRAPFAGRAWVSVETDRVLASFDVDLPGNAATIDVPVSAAMHPNACVHVYLFRPGSQGVPAERMGSCELRVRRPETELNIAIALDAPKVEPGQRVSGIVTVGMADRPVANADLTLFAVDEAILSYGQWHLPALADVFFPRRWHGVSTTSGLQQFTPRDEDEPLFQKGFLLGDGSLGWRSRFVRSRFLPLAFWQGSVRTDANGRASFTFNAPDNLTDYRIVAVAHAGTEAFGDASHHVQVARKLQAEPALPRFVRAGDEVDLRVILRQGEWPELAVEAGCEVEGATLTCDASTKKNLARALPQPVVFRAKVKPDATRLRVRFVVRATQGTSVEDAVEMELPVRPATIMRRETIAGPIPAEGWAPASALPAAWREGQGSVDVLVSSSPWLPLLAGLPSVLEYPHGCVEQLSGRVLSLALMGDLLRSLPDGDARAPEYRRRVQDGLTRLARAQLTDGDMPYWPGSYTTNTFATIQTAWAVVEAQRSGWTTPEPVVAKLRGALIRIARRQDGVRVGAPLRAFSLMVAASLELEPKPRIEALELFRQRDVLGDDGRAFLALALHRFGILPDEKRQLIAELEREPAERAFAPAIFGSTARTAALRLCARATVAGGEWTEDERADQRRALTALMASSQNFSTQEHLWMLLAFRALVRSEGGAGAAHWEIPFPNPARSADGRAVGWFAQTLAEFNQQFAGSLHLGGGTGSYLLRAAWRAPGPEPRLDRGFRLERIVRNLTARARDGSAAAPFQIGDELAVTFRLLTERSQAYVALEESLPAAFETVDPDYYRTTQRDRLAALDDGNVLSLSHWEKRDDRTLWYFDTLESGAGSYTAIVRVTSAGRFHWPGASIAPMYDARFSGLSEGQIIEVR